MCLPLSTYVYTQATLSTNLPTFINAHGYVMPDTATYTFMDTMHAPTNPYLGNQ